MATDDDRVKLPAHQPDCTGEKIETFTASGLIPGVYQVTPCIGCGAQITEAPEEEPLTPGSEAWLAAWSNDKERIARHLTDAELHDPTLNPIHPNAISWPNLMRTYP